MYTRPIKWRNIMIECVLLVLIMASVITVTVSYHSPVIPPPIVPPPSSFCQPQPPFMDNNSGVGVINVKVSSTDDTNEYIGLSDGKFAFNTLGPDGVFKCQASQSLNKGDVKQAESLWKRALERQSNDAEVLIYQEDQRILDANLPYITIVVGAVLTGNVIGSGLDMLQGSYTVQKRYNQEHANFVQVRLLVANFGSTAATNGPMVAQQIMKVASKNQAIKAMVDLPASANILSVINILSASDFPIVLSGGSTSSQEDNANFFHISSSTTEQGKVAAKYVEQNCPDASDEEQAFDCPRPNVTLFMDVDDRYSSSLGQAFVTQLSNDKETRRVNKSVSVVYYKSMDIKSIVERVKDFGASPPDLIYFAGNAIDADTLLQILPETGRYANLRVLGGDALYQTSAYHSNTYRRLNFTSFAYPDEWDILPHRQSKPDFFCDYAIDFAGGRVSGPMCDYSQDSPAGRLGYGYSRPENDVILSHDALATVLQSVQSVAFGDVPSRSQILDGIRSINGSQAFEGASGRIAFGPDGNPIDKTILVLRVNKFALTRLQTHYGTF